MKSFNYNIGDSILYFIIMIFVVIGTISSSIFFFGINNESIVGGLIVGIILVGGFYATRENELKRALFKINGK